jgi:hypothetical protein
MPRAASLPARKVKWSPPGVGPFSMSVHHAVEIAPSLRESAQSLDAATNRAPARAVLVEHELEVV